MQVLTLNRLIGALIILVDLRQERIGSDFRVPVLAVAVGIYLPIDLTVPIFIGGMISHLANKKGATEVTRRNGLLLSSGLITGEALMGILVAVPIFITSNKDWWPTFSSLTWLGTLFFIAVMYWLYRTLVSSKQ